MRNRLRRLPAGSAITNTLDGFAATQRFVPLSQGKSIDGKDRNGDGDIFDDVVTLSDRVSGALQPLGARLVAELQEPMGGPLIRTSAPPFTSPALSVEGDFVAFLESEVGEKRCDETGDEDVADNLLRIFRLRRRRNHGLPAACVDAAPKIDGSSLKISQAMCFSQLGIRRWQARDERT